MKWPRWLLRLDCWLRGVPGPEKSIIQAPAGKLLGFGMSSVNGKDRLPWKR